MPDDPAPELTLIRSELRRILAVATDAGDVRLPSERGLAARLHVGRAAVRRVLAELTAAGELERSPRRRSVVSGRGDSSAKSGKIMLLTPVPFAATVDPGANDLVNLVAAVLDEAALHGREAVYAPTYGIDTSDPTILDRVLAGRVAGFIFAPFGETSSAALAALNRRGLPWVMVSTLPQGEQGRCCRIDIDNQATTRLATEALFASGRKRVAFVHHDHHPTTWERDRFTGYRTACTAAGREPLLLPTSQVSDWVAALRRTQTAGAVCVIDSLGYELLDRLSAAGLRVPDDVGVWGIGNNSPAVARGLSSVSTRAEEIGRLAFHCLLAGAAPSEHLLRPVMFPRRTG